MRRLIVVALLIACEPSTANAPSPVVDMPTAALSSAAPASARPSPSAGPRVDPAVVALDVLIGDAVAQPGRIPPRPGGSVAIGPTSVAVDEGGAVWLLDIAKTRLVSYVRGTYSRAVALAASPPASALLISGGHAYLRDSDDRGNTLREVEFSLATGALERAAMVSAGEPSLYPRERRTWPFNLEIAKGIPSQIGHDPAGFAYDREFRLQVNLGEPAGSVRRLDAGGRVIAVGPFALGTATPKDYFIASDGALYQMEWLSNSGVIIERVAVTRVLSSR